MAKKKEKATGRRGRQPRAKTDGVVNLLRPRHVEAIKEIADTMSKEDVSVTVGQLNGCLYSREELRLAYDEYNAAKENGKTLPSVPAIYQPVVVDMIKHLNCSVAIQGQPSRTANEPSVWPNHLGAWVEGRKIEDTVRSFHINDLRKNVRNVDENLVQIGQTFYVLGDEKTSAVFNLASNKTGNYAANANSALKLSLDGNSAIVNIVAKFNPNPVIERMDDGTKPGSEVVFGSNQLATWGYFIRNDRKMNYDQIRKAVADSDTTGMKFVELEKPIVGNGFDFSKLFQSVKRMMSLVATKDEDDNTAYDRFKARNGRNSDEQDVRLDVERNLSVQLRTEPSNLTPYGFENVQCGNPIVMYYEDDIDTPMYRVILGSRIGHEFSEGKREAKRRLSASTVEEVEVVEKVLEKPKIVKKATTKKKEVSVEKKEKTKPSNNPKRVAKKKVAITVEEAPDIEDIEDIEETTAAEVEQEEVIAADVVAE